MSSLEFSEIVIPAWENRAISRRDFGADKESAPKHNRCKS